MAELSTLSDAKEAISRSGQTIVEAADKAAEQGASEAMNLFERHPWLCIGAAAGVGFLVARAAETLADQARQPSSGQHSHPSHSSPSPSPSPSPGAGKAGLALAATSFLHHELRGVKSQMLTHGLGMVRELVKHSVAPTLGDKVEHIFDRAVRALGVTPPPATSGAGHSKEQKGEASRSTQSGSPDPSSKQAPRTTDNV